MIICFLFLIAVIISFFFLCSNKYRELGSWSLLLAAISCFLLAIWLTVYLFFIYDKKYVYVTDADSHLGTASWNLGWVNSDDYPDKPRWYKQNKIYYLLHHIALEIVFGVLFITYFFICREWLSK